MSVECEFCKKVFSNKYIFKNHQNTAKYCLKLQGTTISESDKNVKDTKSYTCKGCNKSISREDYYNTHIVNCKSLKIKLLTNNLEKQTQKLTKTIKKHKKAMKEQEEKYEIKLRKQEEKHLIEIRILQDKLENLATKAIEKPTQQVVKTTNNTTNNVLNLTPLDLDKEDFKEKIEEGYDIQYFLKGTRGVAEFTKDKLLVDDEGKSRYICVDPARQIFKYVDENGETHRDVKANKLTKKVAPDILNKANKIVVEERENKENYKCTIDKITDIFFIINDLKDNPDKLAAELSKIICD
jgi:hypothetical protein